MKNLFNRRVRGWLAALVWAVAVYALLEFVKGYFFDVRVWPGTWSKDVAAHLVLAALLYAMARNLKTYGLAYLLVASLFHISNALKMTTLGLPIMPDDFAAASNMFFLFDDWRLVGMILALTVPLLALLTMIHWRKRSAWACLILIVVSFTAMISWPQQIVAYMDARFGDWVWNQPGNYRDRGLLIHLLQETARNLSRAQNTPSADEVNKALTILGFEPRATTPVASSGAPRNVHIILLESFWDPIVLSAAELSADPMDPAFRRLWAETRHSTTLAPVFGGYTANSEFEVLCGFPVAVDSVFFEGWLRRDVPCLPRHLAAAGYRTLVSHPNVPAFWNRVNAYRRIGIQTYWAKPDFELDDMNRNFLGDASLYRQVLGKVQAMLHSEAPLLNYIVTYFGHLDYPLNERRPKVIQTKGDNRMLDGYVNTIYYKSRELIAFLDVLRREDPDGLVVVFGDHLPFLGRNNAGYTDSGILADNRADYTADMFHTHTRTPLIVIDGQRGPLPVGEVPIYRLPELILDLLGDHRPTILRLPPPPLPVTLRPLAGLHLVISERHSIACRDNAEHSDPVCKQTRPWLEALKTLTSDIFSGDQHALKALESRDQQIF